MGINKRAALEEKKILAKTAQGQIDSGLQFYNDAGELEPEITTKPPPKDLDSIVLPLSLLLESLTLPFKASEAVIILDNLCVENALAISNVGITTNIGAGSCAI